MKKVGLIISFLVFTLSAHAIYLSGKYTGNGAATQAIAGLGFKPEVVLVRPGSTAGGAGSWVATSSMTAGTAKGLYTPYDFAAPATGFISSIDADGFTVSKTKGWSNENGVTYYYVAWDDADGMITVGSFTPNEANPAWSNATWYNVGGKCSFGGINYTAIAAGSNHVPPDAAYWTSNGAHAAFGTNINVGYMPKMAWVLGGEGTQWYNLSQPQFTIDGTNSSTISHFSQGSSLDTKAKVMTGLTATGFSINPVNTSTAVHASPANGVKYHYVTFQYHGAIDNQIYAGNGGGSTLQVVTLPNPIFVMVRKTGATSTNAWMKTCEMPATSSYTFGATGPDATAINGINATGFTVNTQGEVNGGSNYEFFVMNGGTCGAAVPCNSVGGSISASANVCSGSNTGTLTLSGHNGSITKWQSSTDGGTTWSDIANVTTSQSYTNLVATTVYRAEVKDGACAAANSATVTITVDPVSVGGAVTADATVCSGSNGATLTLAGHTGTVQKWQSSTDGGATWSDIVNTTTSQAYSNITTTTRYRAVVKSGTCSSANSTAAVITVDPVSVGGTVSSSATVCSGSNGATLNLAGHTGTVTKWQSSTDGGSTWSDIVNATTSQAYLNIVTTTRYRAVVTSGVCAAANATAAVITVDPVSVGGAVTADATVCSGSNGATLTLAGHTGTVQKWQSSTDGGATWSDIVNATTSQAYSNITTTTRYRAVVKSGTCSSANSTAAVITVDPVSVGGAVTADATVCSGANGATLNLAGHTGTVQKWQSSTDAGSTWSDIVNATTSQAYLNITTTTRYRAVIKSGVCFSANSTAAVITVDPVTIGGAVTADATVCSGANGATLNLAGHTGTVQKWQSSTDAGSSWSDIVNATTSQAYLNIVTTTQYRAVVKSGVCPADNSSAATITVDPVTVGGAVTADATVCSGSNGATLNLAGHTGTVQKWQSSTDAGSTWSDIVNATASQVYSNITTTTQYRAVVKSGVCPTDNSSAAIITVDPVSVGGTVSQDATVCEGSNSGILTLAGHTGTVTSWESSTDGFTTTTPIVNNTTSQSYNNITTTTQYRAIVTSGVCPSDNSVAATINVDPISVGGSVTADDTVCSGSNNGTLNLAGYTGTITAWEMSSDNFATSTAIPNVTAALTYTNVTTTRQYRAIVKSGVCPEDNSSSATITVDPVSVGGAVTADVTVCSGSNTGTLNLAGNTGTVIGWESSEDNFVTTTPIANVTASNTFNNITATTKYRAIVTSGVCPADTSVAATVTVDPVSVGGTVGNDATVCSGSNSGTLNLVGNVGSVIDWHYSEDNFATEAAIGNINPSYTFSGLTATTKYRVIVKSGVCPEDTSSFATITVDPVSIGGIVSSDATVCSGGNGATLTLAGYTGTITGWESSEDNLFSTKTVIPNITASQAYSNLTKTTYYRAVVKSGICSSTASAMATITVDPVSVGGAVTADDTVCSGSNSGTLNLAGQVGLITGWERSEDGFVSDIQSMNNTGATQTFTNLIKTTQYRAVVKSGVCAPSNSSAATITVDPVSVGGAVTADAMICKGNNSGALVLAGHTGSIMGWESSEDEFFTKESISNNNATQNYNNLTMTTKYRAIIKSGVCPSVNSSAALLTIDPITVQIDDKAICEGSSTTFDAGAGYTTYTWTGKGTGNGQTTTAIDAGTYTITVTDILGCPATDDAVLTINAFPMPKMGPDTSMCFGQSVVLDPQTATNLNYVWTPGAQSTPTLSVNATGTYSVTVSDNIGCSRKDTIFVQVHALPVVSLGNDTTICDNGYDRVTLHLQYSGAKQLQWNTMDKNVDSIIIGETGTYWVEVTDSNQCYIKESIEVSRLCPDVVLDFPDIMTPNGDGHNDEFQPKEINDVNFQQMIANMEKINFVVYDRWGVKVYESEKVIPRWDGRFNGVDMVSGTYYWVVFYTNTAGKSYEDSGYVTLIR
ncbi:MAG: gliding motility-associated C-terminal domain-containing protein [Flavobacteriales bacterium]